MQQMAGARGRGVGPLGISMEPSGPGPQLFRLEGAVWFLYPEDICFWGNDYIPKKHRPDVASIPSPGGLILGANTPPTSYQFHAQ